MATGIIRNGKFIHDLHQDEEYAFESISKVTEDETFFLTESPLEKSFFDLLNTSNDWRNNSKNTNNPPDYINSTYGWMLDLMIVNDYEKTTDSGKSVNGSRIAKGINKNDFKKKFPNLENIMFEYEDKMTPSYKQYYRNTCRVLDHHTEKISNYKSNHPDCNKIAFAICDISEHEHLLARSNSVKGVIAVHPCFDKQFLRKIKKCGADIVLWFSPYISSPNGNTVKLMIIDIHRLVPEKHGLLVLSLQK